jgi:2-polyprenyl-6-hydroxyphenyl methylase/3-demethylubiquinone-9 3-methyltransferase
MLDVGCGAGVLCHLAADRGLVATGVDPDPRKIGWANASVSSGERTTFVLGGIEAAPAPAYDAIAFVDVLYLEPPEEQARLVGIAAGRLNPGGRVIVKATHTGNRLKSAFTHLQEVVAVRIARLTHGQTIHWAEEEHTARALAEAGLSVTVERVDRGYPHPHVLIVGQAP